MFLDFNSKVYLLGDFNMNLYVNGNIFLRIGLNKNSYFNVIKNYYKICNISGMKQLVDNPTVVTRTCDPSKSRSLHHQFQTWFQVEVKDEIRVLLISFTYFSYFIIPFYGWGSTASRLKSNYEEIYFLPEVPGTHLIDLRRTESTLEPPSSFEHGTPVLGIQLLKVHSVHWGKQSPLNIDFS